MKRDNKATIPTPWWKSWLTVTVIATTGLVLYCVGLPAANEHKGSPQLLMFVIGETILKVTTIGIVVATIKTICTSVWSTMKKQDKAETKNITRHMGLRIILAIVACVGIYILHGVIMYGVFNFSSSDQDGIILPVSIILMIALMGWTFKSIVSSRRHVTSGCVQVQEDSTSKNTTTDVRRLIVIVLICFTAIVITVIVCHGITSTTQNKISPSCIEAEIEIRKDGTWWRRMSKSEIEEAKKIPFEDDVPLVDEKTLPYPTK